MKKFKFTVVTIVEANDEKEAMRKLVKFESDAAERLAMGWTNECVMVDCKVEEVTE